MIDTNHDNICIRDMCQDDIESIHAENLANGWHSDRKVYERYFFQQNNHKLYVFVAEFNGSFAGYTTLRPCAITGPFSNKGIPEISDLNVFIKYRRRGIGSRLLDAAENTARKFNSIVSLGVGLHAGYGSAQRLYIKKGYLFDGSGVWYKGSLLEPYSDCCNDDDLVLYLFKQL